MKALPHEWEACRLSQIYLTRLGTLMCLGQAGLALYCAGSASRLLLNSEWNIEKDLFHNLQNPKSPPISWWFRIQLIVFGVTVGFESLYMLRAFISGPGGINRKLWYMAAWTVGIMGQYAGIEYQVRTRWQIIGSLWQMSTNTIRITPRILTMMIITKDVVFISPYTRLFPQRIRLPYSDEPMISKRLRAKAPSPAPVNSVDASQYRELRSFGPLENLYARPRPRPRSATQIEEEMQEVRLHSPKTRPGVAQTFSYQYRLHPRQFCTMLTPLQSMLMGHNSVSPSSIGVVEVGATCLTTCDLPTSGRSFLWLALLLPRIW